MYIYIPTILSCDILSQNIEPMKLIGKLQKSWMSASFGILDVDSNLNVPSLAG